MTSSAASGYQLGWSPLELGGDEVVGEGEEMGVDDEN